MVWICQASPHAPRSEVHMSPSHQDVPSVWGRSRLRCDMRSLCLRIHRGLQMSWNGIASVMTPDTPGKMSTRREIVRCKLPSFYTFYERAVQCGRCSLLAWADDRLNQRVRTPSAQQSPRIRDACPYARSQAREPCQERRQSWGRRPTVMRTF